MNEAALLLSIGMALGWGSLVRAAAAPTPTASATETARTERVDQEMVKREKRMWDLLFMIPIWFYGKVVDQYGQPVPQAQVKLSAANTLFGPGDKRQMMTDDQGKFSVKGLHGIALVVMTEKKGYRTMTNSYGNFGYVFCAGGEAPHRFPWNPAVFQLWKIGKTENLISFSSVLKPKGNDDIVYFNFLNGKKSNGTNAISVQTWITDVSIEKNKNPEFSWKAVINVPGGGIIQNTNSESFDIEAPIDGYKESVLINMPFDATRWTPIIKNKYYIRFSDGCYASADIKLNVNTYGRCIYLDTHMNPTPEHRNLEMQP